MEESGEQCTVVFALIVTEPASEFVHVGSVTIYAKTTMHCSPDSSVEWGHEMIFFILKAEKIKLVRLTVNCVFRLYGI